MFYIDFESLFFVLNVYDQLISKFYVLLLLIVAVDLHLREIQRERM